MDESIGSKGGHNDRKRIFKILKRKKQKDRETEELEKEVKKKQIYTLIKTLPLVITGATIKELTTPKEKNTKEKNKAIETKENEVTIILKDGTKKIIEVPVNKKIKENEVTIILKDGTKKTIEVPVNKKIKENKKETKESSPLKIEKEEKQNNKQPVKEIKQENIPIPVVKEEKKEKQEKEKSSINIEELNDNQKSKLQKLESRKIIDVYLKQLKDIRYDLRNLIIDYSLLIKEEDNIIKSDEEEKILNRLNEIIKKIEELKDRIRIEDIDKYDDNYIYTLIEEYLNDFKDKKVIKEIKDSELYILISEKLDELDKKKDKFKDKVENKKNELEEKEEKLSELKEKYLKIDKLNKDLNDFYDEQEQLLRELEIKIDNAKTVSERVEVQMETMNKGMSMLLRRLSLLMLIPGPRGAKAFTAMAGIYTHMARNMISPKTITKKYKEIEVKDYSEDIEKNINKIDEVKNSLSKTSKDIDEIIRKVKEEFSLYIGVLKECDELLSNLEKVKSNINEKEYELERIKIKEEKELERNNSKVLEKGTYMM